MLTETGSVVVAVRLSGKSHFIYVRLKLELCSAKKKMIETISSLFTGVSWKMYWIKDSKNSKIDNSMHAY